MNIYYYLLLKNSYILIYINRIIDKFLYKISVIPPT